LSDPGDLKPAPPRASARAFQAFLVRQAVLEASFDRERWSPLARRIEHSALVLQEQAGVSEPAAGVPPPVAPEEELDRDLCAFLEESLRLRGIRGARIAADFHGVESSFEYMTDHRHSCGHRVLAGDHSFPTFGLVRTSWNCLRCGPFSNTPAGVPFPVMCQEAGGRVTLAHPSLPYEQATWIAACLEPFGSLCDDTAGPQQVADLRTPVVLQRCRREAIPGLQYLVAAIVTGGDFLVVRAEI